MNLVKVREGNSMSVNCSNLFVVSKQTAQKYHNKWYANNQKYNSPF